MNAGKERGEVQNNRIKGGKLSYGRALKSIAACAVVSALAVSAASASGMQAHADSHEYADASITVVPRANEGATYDAFKLFDADIDGTDRATNVVWASNAARSVVLSFFGGLSGEESYSSWLASRGYAQADAASSAQNALEFIAERISSDSNDADFGGTPLAKSRGSFADRLARAVASSSVPKTTTGTDGVVSGSEGYYLIVSTPSSVGDDEGGSAPMWVPLGGSLTEISAKEAKAALAFLVREGEGDSWGVAADANIGQDIEFLVRGSFPDNIGSYPSFHDKYEITLPAGMVASGTSSAGGDAATSSFSVFIGGVDVTSSATISSSGNTVTVELADAVSIAGEAAAKGGCVEIGYKAHLDSTAALGSAGNPTMVARTFTKDPMTLSEGMSASQAASVYSYQAKVVKIDKSTHEKVPGAKFTVAVSGSQGQPASYVQADGSLASTPHSFETNENGEFWIIGIDEGVYTIAEVEAPNGYAVQDADISLGIASHVDPSTGVLTLEARVSGGEAALLAGDEATKLLSEDASEGLVVVQAVDERELGLPLTGLPMRSGLYCAALAVGVVGVSALCARPRGMRKRPEL